MNRCRVLKLQQLGQLKWMTLVPRTIKTAKIVAESMEQELFVESEILGYRIASCCCNYGGVRQRWLVIESKKRRDSNLKQLEKRLAKQLKIATSELKSLIKQDFACPKGYRFAYAADAQQAADKLSRSWKYHCLESVEIETHPHYNKAGRPTKNQSPEYFTYRVSAHVVSVEKVIEIARRRAGRFVLATNVLDEELLSNDEVLIEYQGQQSSIPTLRWVFQCFQVVHLIYLNHQRQISNLSDLRLRILRFFGSPCQKYYLIC